MRQGGREDWQAAHPYITWLVKHGYASAEHDAWRRAERETRQFIRDEWPTIERVARALLAHGYLNAERIDTLIRGATT